MATLGTNIDLERNSNLVHSRIYLTAALILAVTFLILLQVVYLQVMRHDHFTTLSKSNHIKILPVVPSRGLIFSSDGILLADNRPSFTLELVPERVADVEAVIDQLNRLITIAPDDIERFRELRKRSRRFEGIPLRFNLSDEEVALVSVNRHLLAGIDVVASLSRYYPLAGSLSHTVGYVGMIDEDEFEKLNKSNYRGTTYIGKSGIEKAYEGLLHGHVGYQQVEVNAQGRKIREIYREPPEPSKDLYLTIDASLQILAVQALNDRARGDSCNGYPHRRSAGFSQFSRLRPKPLHRRYRQKDLCRTAAVQGYTVIEPYLTRQISSRFDDQTHAGAGEPEPASARTRRRDLVSRLVFNQRQCPPLPGLEKRGTRPRGHGQCHCPVV